MRFFGSIVSLATALLVLASCTKGGKDIDVVLPSGEKAKLPVAETLRIRLFSEPPSLDWLKLGDTSSTKITANLMDGLVEYDLNDPELNLVPALATKWESFDKGQKWKITLREGVLWSDGKPFTAQHVIDGWKRLLNRETASRYAYFLFGLKNARPYNEGKKEFSDVGAKITGPFEVTVELERPMAYFPYLLTHHSTFPIRMDVVEKHGEKWTEPGNMVSLGPYTLKAWEHDRIVALERNDKYWGPKAETKYLVAYMIQEGSTAINLFDSGKLDSVHDLPSVELRKLRGRKEYRQKSRLSTYYYGFNVKKPPMDNVDVRKAIAMAIDRQQIVQILNGGQVPMTSWVPVGMFGYEAERGLAFNPEKAKEHLKKAGYADPSKFPKLELKFNTLEDHQLIAENVQAQLKKNLGIDLELKNEEWKVYMNSIKTDPPHIFRYGWQADYPDPDNFFAVLLSYSENNHTRWKNKKYDELIEKAASAPTKEERRKIYTEAHKILVEEELPVVPFYTSVSHILVAPRIENYPLNVMELYHFRGAKIK